MNISTMMSVENNINRSTSDAEVDKLANEHYSDVIAHIEVILK